jgi:PAS domain S-box-containing protein
MTSKDDQTSQIDELLATPDLADALESEQFKRFLDQIPIAIIVAELKGPERIVYANPEFEKLCRQSSEEVYGKPWDVLDRHRDEEDPTRGLGGAVAHTSDYVGVFQIECPEEPALADVYSNIIQNDDGVPLFRLVALVNVTAHGKAERETLKERIREKDTLLKEIQHRVKK